MIKIFTLGFIEVHLAYIRTRTANLCIAQFYHEPREIHAEQIVFINLLLSSKCSASCKTNLWKIFS